MFLHYIQFPNISGPSSKSTSKSTTAHTRLPPTLTNLWFYGDSDYLEDRDIVSRIETPLLGRVIIFFFNRLIFNIPLLLDFLRLLGLCGVAFLHRK